MVIRDGNKKRALYLAAITMVSSLWIGRAEVSQSMRFFGDGGDCAMCQSRAALVVNDTIPESRVPLNQNLLDHLNVDVGRGVNLRLDPGILGDPASNWMRNPQLFYAAPPRDLFSEWHQSMIPLQPALFRGTQFGFPSRDSAPSWMNGFYTSLVPSFDFLVP